MKEEWLFPGAVVPVDVETTAALVVEIKRLIDVVGGMALVQPAQRTWVGLDDKDYRELHLQMGPTYFYQDYGRAIEAKLRSKNEDRN
jgi:hypothetical protein